MKKNNAFTLMELMVVVILIGIMAGFAIPNYQRTVQKAHERDAKIQLNTIKAANDIYMASEDQYIPGTLNADELNDQLNINIIADELTYSYTRNSATTYTATATWQGGAPFVMRITEIPIAQCPDPSPNPCCSSNDCLIEDNCDCS